MFAREILGSSPLGTPYTVETALWTVAEDGSCHPGGVIPGTECTSGGFVEPDGAPADVHLCEPNAGLPTGIILPEGSDASPKWCAIEFFLGYRTPEGGAGFVAAEEDQLIGGRAGDDLVPRSIVWVERCPITGNGPFDVALNEFEPPFLDFANAVVCTVPAGPCCFDEGGCVAIGEEDCGGQNGTHAGISVLGDLKECIDTDGDHVYDECDNCLDVPNPLQRDCDADGEGDLCEGDPDDQDDDFDGTCNAEDGCPSDPIKSVPGTGLGEAPGQCGCGNLDVDSDGDSAADCIDQCPLDPNKTEPAPCGCGSSPGDDADDDGDAFPNCIDTCAGADDALFGPCQPNDIPTVSAWGLLNLTLLLLVAAKIYYAERRDPRIC